jgi:hypothetical protein
MHRIGYVDGREQAEHFDQGDHVRIMNERTGTPSGWVGVITGIDETAGVVTIRTPFNGEMRHRAEIVVPVDDPDVADFYRQEEYVEEEDSSSATDKVASTYSRNVVSRLIEGASRCRRADMGELATYRFMSSRYGASFSDTEIKDAVRTAFVEDRASKDLAKLASTGDRKISKHARDLMDSLFVE